MPVPSLGDSIVDGTVLSIEKPAGSTVQADDVLVVIETDKLSVDIRAPHAGKVVKFHVNEGEEVEVGKSLVDIDDAVDASASQETAPKDAEAASPAPSPASAPAPAPAPSPSPAPAPSSPPAEEGHPRGHQPRIQFRHGRVNQGKEQATGAPAASGSSSFSGVEEQPSKAELDFMDLPPRYGRPPITQRELDALHLGGSE